MQKKPDYMVLVNGENALPDGFEDTVEFVSAENAAGEKYTIEEKTYAAFLRLQADLLENDGLQAELISAHRSYQGQVEIFNRYAEQHGMDYAKKYAAIPGHSEHQLGLAIDVSFLVDGKLSRAIADLLSYEDWFQIVHRKLPEYGFILRYPAHKQDITKIGYEPWHFRYIDSPEIAREIAARGICFEEYHQER